MWFARFREMILTAAILAFAAPHSVFAKTSCKSSVLGFCTTYYTEEEQRAVNEQVALELGEALAPAGVLLQRRSHGKG